MRLLMTYVRTPQQRRDDFKNARAWEEEVASHLPEWRITRFDANDDLDIWVPGYFLECKTKLQKLTGRWVDAWKADKDDETRHAAYSWLEPGLFIMDELSVRRALKHYNQAYFLIKDQPCDRLFIASALEVACVERVRVNRDGKGKWILDMTQLRRLPSLDQLNEFIQADMVGLPHKQSACISYVKDVPEI